MFFLSKAGDTVMLQWIKDRKCSEENCFEVLYVRNIKVFRVNVTKMKSAYWMRPLKHYGGLVNIIFHTLN